MAERTTGQTLLSVAVSVEMLAAIDDKRGTTTRSAFVRESLAAHLGINRALACAPDRTGKGGRGKKTQFTPEEHDQESMQHPKMDEATRARLMEQVSTPLAQDALLNIKDKVMRLKAMENLNALKAEEASKKLKAVPGTGGKKADAG